ncbi:hypothetical protein CTI12_AA583040 [Artemisia annua]|uniref:Helitron helicase-like domain-containing protein n=1 Tax=Artemisia annua TaxID=35608 RepID=A0A2U1KN99_ARTAN|nr:hypothetical protein CTI12_AA583040 [Artemisia annua]
MKTKQKAKRRVSSAGPLACKGNYAYDEGDGCYNIDIEPYLALSNTRTVGPSIKSSRLAGDDVEVFHSYAQKTGAQYELGDTNTVLSYHPSQQQCASQKAQVYQDMANDMTEPAKQKTVNRMEGIQMTTAPTFAKNISCTEKTVRLLDKGKRKMHDICHEHYPFTRDSIDVNGHTNDANLTSTQNWQINNDNEAPAVSAHSMHKKCHLHSRIDLQNAGSSSNDVQRQRSTRQRTHGSHSLNHPQKNNGRVHESQVRMYSSQQSQHHSCQRHNRRATARKGPLDSYIRMGQPDKICRHCKAIFWYDERVTSSRSGRPEYHKCCNAGKVKIDTQHIVQGLLGLLDEHNELVCLFRTARDKMANADIPQFKVHLFGVVGSKQHELPTGDSIGAIVFEGGTDDVIIEQSDGQSQRISKLNPSYISLQFPMIFIYGEEGYHLNRFLLTAAGSPSDPPKLAN